MKNPFIVCLAVAGTLSAATLEEEFLAPPPGYGEVPFWWWTGERLDKERLAWQLEELHAKGVSGTQVNYSHLISENWKTVPVEPAIFSDDWWDVFAFAAAKSAELGMGIGLSGYTIDWPGNDNLFRRLGITSDDSRGRVLEWRDGKAVPVVRDRTLDPMNPASARKVIDRFFKPFWEKLPESSRVALDYFFQDELRLAGNRYVWCDDFPEEFRRRKGYDLVPKLPLLFATNVTAEAARVRIDYNDVMVELEEERYFRPIYDWHASRGKIYACDSATRGYNPAEFGDYMRCMRWYTAPGFDTPRGKADAVKCKMGSSISHLYRRPRVWLEGYHSLGWQANTASIFEATARNYAYGANLLNLHGLYYSTYGGWWEWAPPCYHFHQPYWTLMGTTLKYFERLSYLLTRGDHVCDVAIVTPQEPCAVDPERAMKTSVPLAHAVVKRLAVDGATDCDFVDADSLAAAVVTNDAFGVGLAVAGEVYRVVVLPDMFAIHAASKAKLDAFAAKGGRVIDAKKVEDVPLPLLATPDVAGHPGLKVNHRRTATHDIYYLVDWDEKTPIRLRAKGTLEYWDAWTGRKLAEPRRSEPVLAVVRHPVDAVVPIASKGKNQSSSDAFETNASTENVSVVIPFKGKGEPRKVSLSGPWRMTFKPVLDNRFGDYRLPATRELMGPEVRQMRWAERNRDELLGSGPQFFHSASSPSTPTPTTTSTSTSTSTTLYTYSWRYGPIDKPAQQDNFHGLNRVISDYFLVMGPYDWKWPYDIWPEGDDNLQTNRFTTFVYAPRELAARIEGGVERPHAIFPSTSNTCVNPVVVSLTVGGAPQAIGDVVTLKAGYTPVEVTYRGCGRAALVFVACSTTTAAVAKPATTAAVSKPATTAAASKPATTAAASKPVDAIVSIASKGGKRSSSDAFETNASTERLPLSMKWTSLPDRLAYDPFGGRETVGTFTATVPPGTVDADVRVNGELLEKKIADGVLTVRVKFAPGFVGGNAFTDVIRLKTETAAAPLGDWARWEGTRCYSGGAVYETTFAFTAAREVTSSTVKGGKGRVELDLGDVGCCAEVRVNGGEARVRTCPPWTFDVTDDLRDGTNALSVTVYNTANNHYQTIPTRYKKPAKEVPSGLLGPVKLILR